MSQGQESCRDQHFLGGFWTLSLTTWEWWSLQDWRWQDKVHLLGLMTKFLFSAPRSGGLQRSQVFIFLRWWWRGWIGGWRRKEWCWTGFWVRLGGIMGAWWLCGCQFSWRCRVFFLSWLFLSWWGAAIRPTGVGWRRSRLVLKPLRRRLTTTPASTSMTGSSVGPFIGHRGCPSRGVKPKRLAIHRNT